jgi:hypothetical protein
MGRCKLSKFQFRKELLSFPFRQHFCSAAWCWRHDGLALAVQNLIEDFNCALQKKILLQGHMYLFDRYVCFYSNIFGYEKKVRAPSASTKSHASHCHGMMKDVQDTYSFLDTIKATFKVRNPFCLVRCWPSRSAKLESWFNPFEV